MEQKFAVNQQLELLNQAVTEFKEEPHTPEVITQYWQTLWKIWGERVGLSFTVPSCDRTAEEIRQLEKEGRKLVYVPDELASQENRYLLGEIFSKMQGDFVKRGNLITNLITNESKQGGWFDIEASLDSPNLGIAEKSLEDQFREQGRVGQRLSTYMIGSQEAKLLTGHYFDEKTASYLPGSRYKGLVVVMYCGVLGRLNDLWPLDPPQGSLSSSRWGSRSEKSKKA